MAAAIGAIAPIVTTTLPTPDASATADVEGQLSPPIDLPDFPEFLEARDDFVDSYGMTEDEATSWVVSQEDRITFRETAATLAEETLAGFRQDPTTGIQTVLLVSDEPVEELQALADTLAVPLSFEFVDFSLAELRQVRRELVSGEHPLIGPGLQGAVVDDNTNRVSLYLPPELLDIAINAPEAFHPSIEIFPSIPESENGVDDVCTARTACGRPLRGGISLWRNGVGACTVGYHASGDDGSRWAVSAGHCGQVGDQWGHGQQYFGPVRQRNNNQAPYTEIDVGRARLDNAYWKVSPPGGYLIRIDSSNNALNAPHDIDLAIQFRSTIDVGDWVCLSALSATYGDSCGTVSDESPGSQGDVRVGDYDACRGDSGGAWVTRVSSGDYWAFGVHESSRVGCPTEDSGQPNSSQGFSDFSAVPDINDYWDDLNAAILRIDAQ